MRIESDSIGVLEVPENTYYGVQTLRGFETFQIMGTRMNDTFIRKFEKMEK